MAQTSAAKTKGLMVEKDASSIPLSQRKLQHRRFRSSLAVCPLYHTKARFLGRILKADIY